MIELYKVSKKQAEDKYVRFDTERRRQEDVITDEWHFCGSALPV